MKFPDPEKANPDGLLCVGGELTSEVLISAYSQGIFPWPQEGYPMLWFSPPQRGVLFFDQVKVPESTTRVLKKNIFKVTFNQAFETVLRECSNVHQKRQAGTWISEEMIHAYGELFKKGYAQSVEVWFEDQLVGGLYGVLIHGVFSGESMFYKKTEASKVALVALIDQLSKKNFKWIDIQMVTPVLKQFGGEYISRKEYLKLLKQTQVKD